MKMYKKFKVVGLFLALITFAQTASASLLIEPHLSYNLSGSGDNNGSGATKIDYDYNGAQYGLRLGYQALGLMGGLAYNRSSFDMDYKSAAGGTTTGEMERNEWGLFVGYNFPILVRGWVGYYFSNTTEDTKFNTEYTGNTTELGLGFTALPFVSVNLIYRLVKLDEVKSGGNTGTADIDGREFLIGVSLPLTL